LWSGGFLDGAPLMKFFNARPEQPAKDAAAENRLSSIVERGHAELDWYGQQPPPPLKAEGIQRRFWMPAEVESDEAID
jgi:hypothetical protein